MTQSMKPFGLGSYVYAWVKSAVICSEVSFSKSGARAISSLGRSRLSGIPHIEDKAPFWWLMLVSMHELI